MPPWLRLPPRNSSSWKKGEQGAHDLAHLDQVGFALTLPTSYSWSPVGAPVRVDYEAPQGRRVNGIGAYFTHGPAAGSFYHETYVRFPLPKGLTPEVAQQLARRGTDQGLTLPPGTVAAFRKRAAKHQVQVADFGIIDGEVLVSFLWKISGRPAGADADWRRERPLYVVLDNYSVHHGQVVQAAKAALQAAGIHLVYLPSYSPELSGIEPIWQTTKHHDLPQRSFAHLGDLKWTVDTTLARRAVTLWEAARQKREQLFPRTP